MSKVHEMFRVSLKETLDAIVAGKKVGWGSVSQKLTTGNEELFSDDDWEDLKKEGQVEFLRDILGIGPSKPPARATGPVVHEVISGDTVISSVSALYHLCGHDDRMKSIISGMAPIVATWTVLDTLATFREMAGKFSELHSGSLMGTLVKNVGATAYAGYKAIGTEALLVGPYMLGKLLIQAGASWETSQPLFSADSGMTAIGPTHRIMLPSLNITYHDKFMISLAYPAGGEVEIMGYNAAVNAAISEIPVVKGIYKRLHFEDMSVEAYQMSSAFCLTYSVVAEKGKMLRCAAVSKPPKFGRLVTRFIEVLLASVSKMEPVQLTDADWVHECIARLASRIPNCNEVARSLPVEVNSYSESIKTVEATVKVAKAGKAKLDAVTLGLRITSDVDTALVELDAARRVRNVSNPTQFVQKNVGSIYGPDLLPLVDTLRKGEALVSIIKKSNPEIMLSDECTVNVYGTAHGHMMPAFADLRATTTWYDIQKAKNSLKSFVKGDIMYPEECHVMIDDTFLGTYASDDDCGRFGLPPKTRANVLKVMAIRKLFGTSNLESALIKLTLKDFARENVNQMMKAIEPNDDPKTHLVAHRLYKCGKLHNQEVFLFLSNSDKITPSVPRAILSDAKSCAMAISYTNKVIMSRGQIGGRISTNCHVSHLWRRFVKLLPVAWPWYNYPTAPSTIVYHGDVVSLSMESDLIFPDSEDFNDDYAFTDAPDAPPEATLKGKLEAEMPEA